jgi:hypothetical protein
MKNELLRAAADSEARSNGARNATSHMANSPGKGGSAVMSESDALPCHSLSAITKAITAGPPASTARVLRDAWKALTTSAPDLTAEKAIKRLHPHLVALGYGPATIDDDGIAHLVAHLEKLGRPSPCAETNSFIRAFNTVATLLRSDEARLTLLPTVKNARFAAWAARPRLDRETRAVIKAFRGKLAPNRFRAGVMRIIVIVENAGLPCECLHDLLTQDAIAAVIQSTSPRGLDVPSPARVHALYLLTAIARILNADEALAFIKAKKASKTLKIAGHTALLPTATVDRIAVYDDRDTLLRLLRSVTHALYDALQTKLSRRSLYDAQSALAFLLAFYGGLTPTQIALCQFTRKDRDALEEHEQSSGTLKTAFRAQEGLHPVNLSDRIKTYVTCYRAWLATHDFHPDHPFVTMRGESRPGKNVEHGLASFLKQMGSELRPLDVRDLGCSELLRSRRGFAFVRAHLRASTTENVANRLRPLRTRLTHTEVQEATLTRAEAINARRS